MLTANNYKYEVRTRSFGLPWKGYVTSSSRDHLVFRTFPNIPLENMQIGVFTISTHRWWQVPINGTHLAAIAEKNEYHLVNTEHILVLKIDLYGPVPRSLIKVWNLRSRLQIYADIVLRLEYLIVNEWQHPDILILLSAATQEAIIVLNFSNIYDIKRCSAMGFNNEHSFGTFEYPWVTNCVFDPLYDLKSVFVWLYNEEENTISILHHLIDVEEFIKFPRAFGVIRTVIDVNYVAQGFIITAEVVIRQVFSDGIVFFFTLVIMFIDEEGTIKNCHILYKNISKQLELFIFEGKLLFEIENQVYIFEKTLPTLFQHRSIKTIKELLSDDPMRVHHLPHLDSTAIAMFDTTEARKVETNYNVRGEWRVRIVSLNFWSKA